MMVENLLKILVEKGRRFTIAYNVHAVTNAVGESIFISNLRNIYCETVR